MNFNIKKIYKETVKQLKKHQTEIEIALALAAVVALEDDEEVTAAKEDIIIRYQDLIGVYKYHIDAISRMAGDLDDIE
jgi:hypothetical protein